MSEEQSLYNTLNEAKEHVAKVRDKMLESRNTLIFQVLSLIDELIDNIIAYNFGGGVIDDVNLIKSIVLTIESLQNVVDNDARQKLEDAKKFLLIYVNAKEAELEEEEEELANIFEDDIEESVDEDEDEDFFDASIF